jgi:hypothetical protein
VPFLLITGYLDQQAACERLGYPHLAKPFSLQALANAAMTAMRKGPASPRITQSSGGSHRSRAATHELHQFGCN